MARDSERDRFWSAQAAVDYGFCDRVVTDLDQILPLWHSGERTGLGR
ncbi:MAG: ATP-dependent Clp protease proteolytic subunit [Brachybacterium sp.]|nr:ATP-dependent Clp protease proteolytic subunit [Brachybacterium sp.]